MILQALRTPPVGFESEFIDAPRLTRLQWPVNAVALDVAGRCNIACRYCAEGATQPAGRPSMEPEVMDHALALLDSTSGVTSVRLGSGEPLLAGDLLRLLKERVDQRAGEKRNVPRVYLTTNGTLLDRDTRDFLVKSGWDVKVSLDGPAEIHDRWRITATGRGTWERVAASVKELAQRMPERLSVTAVLCRGSDAAMVFAAIAALGVRRIELVPAVHEDPAIAPVAADLERYRAFVLDWADGYVAGPTVELVRVMNMARRVMGYDVNRISCGAGRTFMGVGADGTLYPCFRFIGLENYRLGSVRDGVDERAATEFRTHAARPYEKRQACQACWAAPLCGGPCFATAELFGTGGGEPYEPQCAYTLCDAHAAWHLVEKQRAKAPERLLKLIPHALAL